MRSELPRAGERGAARVIGLPLLLLIALVAYAGQQAATAAKITPRNHFE